jgi:hypothetical protein
MAKLKLQPDPTFRAKVGIAVPGAAAVEVEFTFKYRNRDEVQAFIDASKERDNVATILEMCTGWELTDPFTAENIATLVLNYIAAPEAIFIQYLDELTRAARKN